MPDLTPAERRVLILLMQGLSTRQIAESCVATPATINGHIRHLYSKSETHHRVALVNWGRRWARREADELEGLLVPEEDDSGTPAH